VKIFQNVFLGATFFETPGMQKLPMPSCDVLPHIQNVTHTYPNRTPIQANTD